MDAKCVHRQEAPVFPDMQIVLDAIAQPVYCKDNDGYFTHVNDEFCNIIQIPREKILGRTVDDLANAENARTFRAADTRLLASDRDDQSYESEYVRLTGERLFVRFYKRKIRNSIGDVIGIIGTITDLTDLHETQLQLADERSKLRERVKEINCIFDICRLLDDYSISPDSSLQFVADRIPAAFFNPDTTSSEIELDGRCYRSAMFMTDGPSMSEPIEINNIIRGKVSVFAGNSSSPPFLEEEKTLITQIAYQVCLTISRHDAALELAEQTSRFSATFNQAAVGICHVSPKGDILRANQRLCDIWGYRANEVTGIRFQDITHPDDLAQDLDMLNRLISGEIDTYSIDKRYFTKDDTIIWCELTVSVVRNTDGSPDYFISVVEDITDRKRDSFKIQQLTRKASDTLLDTISALSHAIEARDPYTAGHQSQVATIAAAIGQEIGLSEQQLEGLRVGASIHDIGKIAIPSEILSKPGKLSDEEFALIKTHPQSGYQIIKDIDMPWPVAEMILQHHERIDGSGYPQGTKAGDILIESRIIAVADTLEAMTTRRPYRANLGLDKAIGELKAQRGTKFDMKVVDICLRLIEERGQFWEPEEADSNQTTPSALSAVSSSSVSPSQSL